MSTCFCLRLERPEVDDFHRDTLRLLECFPWRVAVEGFPWLPTVGSKQVCFNLIHAWGYRRHELLYNMTYDMILVDFVDIILLGHLSH